MAPECLVCLFRRRGNGLPPLIASSSTPWMGSGWLQPVSSAKYELFSLRKGPSLSRRCARRHRSCWTGYCTKSQDADPGRSTRGRARNARSARSLGCSRTSPTPLAGRGRYRPTKSRGRYLTWKESLPHQFRAELAMMQLLVPRGRTIARLHARLLNLVIVFSHKFYWTVIMGPKKGFIT